MMMLQIKGMRKFMASLELLDSMNGSFQSVPTNSQKMRRKKKPDSHNLSNYKIRLLFINIQKGLYISKEIRNVLKNGMEKCTVRREKNQSVRLSQIIGY